MWVQSFNKVMKHTVSVLMMYACGIMIYRLFNVPIKTGSMKYFMNVTYHLFDFSIQQNLQNKI